MMKLFFCMLVILVILAQAYSRETTFSMNQSYGKVMQQTVNDWRLDASSGIPVWIAWKEEINNGCRLIVYMEPQNYNLENLKKVFISLSHQYEDAFYVMVDLQISKNVVQDKVTVKRKGYQISTLPESARSNESEDLSATNGKIFSAWYFRGQDSETIYYDDPKTNTNIKLYLKGEDSTTLKTDLASQMIQAVSEGNLVKVDELFKKGAPINIKNDGEWSLLDYAIKNNKIDILKFLLAKGADVSGKTGGNGWTPLIMASGLGNIKAIKALIDAGADINETDNNGNTALIVAAREGRMASVKYLLSYGANINHQNNVGETAHKIAYDEKIKKLLTSGASF